MPDATAPNALEPITLAGVMGELDRRGFTAHFALRNGRLRAMGSARAFAPIDIEIAETYRFEGVSDPDDLAILYAIETRGGLRGTLTDAYGVYADPSIAEFLGHVAVRREELHARRQAS